MLNIERNGMMDLYEQLMHAAYDAINEIQPNASQIIVTKTVKGAVYTFMNDLSDTAEERFLSFQGETLAALLCIWTNRQIDLPSIRIRKGLLQINPKNGNTAVFLQGEKTIAKPLSQTIV